MRIKTVVEKYAATFDEQVNEALEHGWYLKSLELKRLKEGTYHYAQLVLSEEAPEPEPLAITWQEALKVLQDTCEGAKECSGHGCSMFAWCNETFKNTLAPAHWDIPAEEV